jgi:K+-sensing histidine kinase KdpD
MSAISATSSSDGAELQVAMGDVVRFMRQLSHDLRNHLNAAELQSAFLGEIAEDPEVKSEIKRLRAMISELATSLQRVTATIADVKVNRIEYGAADFVEDIRQKLATDFPDASADVQWDVKLDSGAMLNIDPQLLQQATTELFNNAFRHTRGDGPIEVGAHVDDKEFVLNVCEPKSGFERSTESWGREPFQSVGQGHYGLGLHRVRRILEAHEGQFAAHYDAAKSSLITTVRLPLLDDSK